MARSGSGFGSGSGSSACVAMSQWKCGNECILDYSQCHGQCQEGWVPCGGGSWCIRKDRRDEYWECGDSCLFKSRPCDSTCPPDHFLCCDSCIPEDDLLVREDEDMLVREDEDMLVRENEDMIFREDEDMISREDEDMISREGPNVSSENVLSRAEPASPSKSWPSKADTSLSSQKWLPRADTDLSSESMLSRSEPAVSSKRWISKLDPAVSSESVPRMEPPGRWMCGQDCIPTSKPCQGECPHGSFLCGKLCVSNRRRWFLRSCGSECINEGKQCNGSCPSHTPVHCGNTTYLPMSDRFYKTCGTKCIFVKYNYEICNGSCPEGLYPCGDWCIEDTSTDGCPCTNATIKCGHVRNDRECRLNTTTNQQRCGEACFKFNQTTGALSTAQYPERYLSDQYCSMNISAPLGYQVLITFHDFDFFSYQSLDALKMYDNADTDKKDYLKKQFVNDTFI